MLSASGVPAAYVAVEGSRILADVHRGLPAEIE
jgi:hypothetical protein